MWHHRNWQCKTCSVKSVKCNIHKHPTHFIPSEVSCDDVVVMPFSVLLCIHYSIQMLFCHDYLWYRRPLAKCVESSFFSISDCDGIQYEDSIFANAHLLLLFQCTTASVLSLVELFVERCRVAVESLVIASVHLISFFVALLLLIVGPAPTTMMVPPHRCRFEPMSPLFVLCLGCLSSVQIDLFRLLFVCEVLHEVATRSCDVNGWKSFR